MKSFQKIIAAFLSVLMITTAFPTVFAEDKIMMIDDFEFYYSDGEIISEALSTFWTEKNLKTNLSLSKNGGLNGSQGWGIDLEYIPDIMSAGLMNVLTINMEGRKKNWSNYDYLMLWAKNENNFNIRMRFSFTDVDGKEWRYGNGATLYEVENRTGEGVFKNFAPPDSNDFYIPANFEGYIRFPLAKYGAASCDKKIETFNIICRGSSLNPKFNYVIDEICLTTDDYVVPATKSYPPRVDKAYTNFNYKTMQVRFDCTVIGREKTELITKITSPSGKVMYNKNLTYGDDGVIKEYIQMPEDMETGQYTITVLPASGDENDVNTYYFTYYGQKTPVYTDIDGIDEEHIIGILSQLGIVTGYVDGSFLPDRQVTRAEFSALMTRLLGLEGVQAAAAADFNDTKSHWAANNIALAAERGIINGYGNGSFGPDDTVTFEQAVKMLVAAVGYSNEAEALGGYPQGYIAQAEKCGITIKKDELGNPVVMTSEGGATRANISVLLANTLRTEISDNGALTGTTLLTEHHSEKMRQVRLNTITEYGDNLLTYAKDNVGKEPSPLIYSGIRPETYEPLVWLFEDNVIAPTNYASSQNPMRVLVALTELTGEPKYRQAAEDMVNYMFDTQKNGPSGLLSMGGHGWTDAFTDEVQGRKTTFELKDIYPYYEFWYEVRPEDTDQFIKGVWNALIANWNTFEITRHGNTLATMGKLWESSYTPRKPLSYSQHLSFLNAGSDLIHAGAIYTMLTGDEKAYIWAERMYEQYANARHPNSKIIPSQFTVPAKNREMPPEIAASTNAGDFVTSYGDRVTYQFGPEFGDVAIEAWKFNANYLYCVGSVPYVMLNIYNQIGKNADKFREWTVDSLVDYLKLAYNSEDHTFSNIFADGTRFDDFELQRNGFNGPKGYVFTRQPVNSSAFLPYCRAYNISKNKTIWKFLRNIGIYGGIGDIGTEPGVDVKLNYAVKTDDTKLLLGLIDLYEVTGCIEYLKVAEAIGNNIAFDDFVEGFQMKPNGQYLRYMSKPDEPEPVALTLLEGALAGKTALMPTYYGGQGYLEGPYTGRSTSDIGDESFYTGRKPNEY